MTKPDTAISLSHGQHRLIGEHWRLQRELEEPGWRYLWRWLRCIHNPMSMLVFMSAFSLFFWFGIPLLDDGAGPLDQGPVILLTMGKHLVGAWQSGAWSVCDRACTHYTAQGCDAAESLLWEAFWQSGFITLFFVVSMLLIAVTLYRLVIAALCPGILLWRRRSGRLAGMTPSPPVPRCEFRLQQREDGLFDLNELRPSQSLRHVKAVHPDSAAALAEHVGLEIQRWRQATHEPLPLGWRLLHWVPGSPPSYRFCGGFQFELRALVIWVPLVLVQLFATFYSPAVIHPLKGFTFMLIGGLLGLLAAVSGSRRLVHHGTWLVHDPRWPNKPVRIDLPTLDRLELVQDSEGISLSGVELHAEKDTDLRWLQAWIIKHHPHGAFYHRDARRSASDKTGPDKTDPDKAASHKTGPDATLPAQGN